MNKSLLILMTLTVSLFVTAQEKTKQKELGLVFSSLNNFGLTFKTGSNKWLWRFNTLILSGSNFEETGDSLVSKRSNIGFSVQFGKEYRNEIVENLELRFGADLSFRYNKYENDYNDKSVNDFDSFSEQTIYEPGINLVLGLNYVIKDKFVIGAELLPSFRYRTGKSVYGETESDISGFSYGLSNMSALLSLSYRLKTTANNR